MAWLKYLGAGGVAYAGIGGVAHDQIIEASPGLATALLAAESSNWEAAECPADFREQRLAFEGLATRALGVLVHKNTLGGLETDLTGAIAALVVFEIGTWVDGTHTFSLEHSDNGTQWSAVGASQIGGTCPVVSSAGTDERVVFVWYLGNKQYVRPVTTVTGTPATGATYGATVVAVIPES